MFKMTFKKTDRHFTTRPDSYS